MSSTGQTLYRRARKVMPGGTQLLSKRPEMFLPGQWPTYFKSAKGAEVVDLDGQTYLDMSFGGIGATVLGFADPDVNAAVKNAVDMGSMCTLNCTEDIELAELLVESHPWADMVRFGRAGGETMAIAVRIARAATGRDTILKFAGGYHGSHDYGLQTLEGTVQVPESLGIPAGVTDSVVVAPFNDLPATAALAESNRDRLAAIIVEPVQRAIPPEPGFLQGLREICDRTGALLVFDEVVTGFRLALGGAQDVYGVTPDLAALAKAMGGGLPLAAVAGRRDLIELTVPRSDRNERAVYMGNTLNGNPLSCAAGLAALEVLEEEGGPEKIAAAGSALATGFREAAARLGIPFQVLGPPAFGDPIIGAGEIRNQADYLRQNRAASAAFGVELLRRGIFVNPGFKMYISTAHGPAEIDQTVEVAEEALRAVRDQGLVD